MLFLLVYDKYTDKNLSLEKKLTEKYFLDEKR